MSAIPREHGNFSVIIGCCENHFLPEEILRERECYDEEKILFGTDWTRHCGWEEQYHRVFRHYRHTFKNTFWAAHRRNESAQNVNNVSWKGWSRGTANKDVINSFEDLRTNLELYFLMKKDREKNNLGASGCFGCFRELKPNSWAESDHSLCIAKRFTCHCKFATKVLHIFKQLPPRFQRIRGNIRSVYFLRDAR